MGQNLVAVLTLSGEPWKATEIFQPRRKYNDICIFSKIFFHMERREERNRVYAAILVKGLWDNLEMRPKKLDDLCSFHFNTIYLNTPRSFKEWRGKPKMGKYWEKTIQYPNCDSSFGSQYNIKELQNSQHKEGLCLFFWCSCVVKLQLVVIGVACVAQRGLIQDCSRVLTTCNFIVSFR